MKLPSVEEMKAVHERTRVDPDIVRAYVTRVKPSWTLLEKPEPGDDGGYAFRRGNIQVLVSLRREQDGNIWIHASLCGRTSASNFHLPSWEDIKRVKNDFIGEDAWAYQVFPDAKNYINQHPCVLHLFALLDGKPALPDFTHGLGVI